MLSLNIIPPAVKTELRTAAALVRWLKVAMILLLLVSLGSAAAVAAWRMLDQHAAATHRDLVAQRQRLSLDAKNDITATTVTLNATIKSLSAALGQAKSWSSLSATVLTGVPTGLTITDLTLQASNQFRFKGTAATRETFVLLDQALKTNPGLTKVTTTLAASKRTAVPFDYTGQIIVGGQTP